jgi:hypothetical protein
MELSGTLTKRAQQNPYLRKGFLQRLMSEWYGMLASAVPPGQGAAVELGAGAGVLKWFIPGLVTTDVTLHDGIRVVGDAGDLPFGLAALRAIVMIDVFHHLPRPRSFLSEASRCLETGGVVAMIEPWVSSWSRWVYRNLHHEPFDADAREWETDCAGPMSGANSALPWIVFCRDRACFEREFPALKIEVIRPMVPFRYLVSGGVSHHGLAPSWTFPAWRLIERSVECWMSGLAMFAFVVLKRV